MPQEITFSTEVRPGVPSDPKKWPKCPNHGCPLDMSAGTGDMHKGAAPCMESNCMFDYEINAEDTREVRDKFGNVTLEHGYTAEGNE